MNKLRDMTETETTYTVRYMEERDLPQVASIEKIIFSQPWSEEGFGAALSMPDNLYVTAVEDGGKSPDAGETVIGYCGLYASFEEGEIVNVAVHPDYRRHKAAQKMLRFLIREGMQKGLKRFILEVRAGNLAAIRLYETLGFESLGIRKRFYEAPVEDALIMELKTDPQNISCICGEIKKTER